MPATNSYDYAVIRVVPCEERGESINVGVLLFCRTQRFLGSAMHLDPLRVQALAPTLDLAFVQRHLDTIELICQGKHEAGPIAYLSQSERFHWLVAPRSTIIQTSPVHSGLSTDPAATLAQLLQKLVLI
ncbi:MAG TPA: DUF3037 domain-containing protein [Ktedonobacteraceae bacterium]|jgi:hypothetical protein|nr:DUF3037 domain-containing protein [Ktedonobacteraceae bacterium]